MSGTGHFIKAWRLHRGLTQEQLAERVGIDKSYLSKIENGRKRYDQPFLEAASEVLNCSPADLIDRDPSHGARIWEIYDKMTASQQDQLTAIAETLSKVG